MIYDITRAILLIASAYLLLKEEPDRIMAMQTIIMSMCITLQKDIAIISAVLVKLLNVKEMMDKEK
jgi:transcription termination factor NusB